MDATTVPIVTAIVSGIVAIIVAVVNTNSKFQDLMAEIKTHNAVQDEKIDQLKEEVSKHNKVIERTYQCEKDIEILKTKVGI